MNEYVCMPSALYIYVCICYDFAFPITRDVPYTNTLCYYRNYDITDAIKVVFAPQTQMIIECRIYTTYVHGIYTHTGSTRELRSLVSAFPIYTITIRIFKLNSTPAL